MPERRDQNSSFIAVLPVIIINLIVSLLFAYFKKNTLSIVFMLLFILGGIAFLWAKASKKDLYCDFNYSTLGLFPGDKLEITVDFRNKKFLPVLWMSVDDRFTDVYSVPALLWHEDTQIKREWIADKRGIKNLENRTVLTGDGFGLRQFFLDNVSGAKSLAVYPKRIEVNPKMFMKNLWNASTGKNGTIEDVTVIKSTRDYMPDDPARYINWRLAARNLPLAVNVYDNIQPRGVHFIFDGESFADHSDELEKALSILASELLELSEAGFNSGLSVCKGLTTEATTYSSDEPIEDMLYSLAAYNLLPPRWEDNQQVSNISEFDCDAILKQTGSVGHFYYICFNQQFAAKSEVVTMLSPESLTLLTYEEGGQQWLENINLQTLLL